MKSALLKWALAGLLTIGANAAGPKAGELAEEAVNGDTPAAGKEAIEYTVFNDIKVPPMKDIKGEEFAETIKSGYW